MPKYCWKFRLPVHSSSSQSVQRIREPLCECIWPWLVQRRSIEICTEAQQPATRQLGELAKLVLVRTLCHCSVGPTRSREARNACQVVRPALIDPLGYVLARGKHRWRRSFYSRFVTLLQSQFLNRDYESDLQSRVKKSRVKIHF